MYVFEHHRFCDEFSLLVNSRLLRLKLSAEVLTKWKGCLKRFKRFIEVSHLLCSCQSPGGGGGTLL